jgi:hypothetical protein
MVGTSQPRVAGGAICALLSAIAAAGCNRSAEGERDDARAGDAAGGAQDAADPERPVPVVETSDLICRLLNDANLSDPTANDVHHRANVRGADLGIPVATADRLFVLFGDTIGNAGIWGFGESHPDAVAYALDAPGDVAANPALLCDRLRIVTLPPEASIGPTIDPQIEADFAGAAMIAPAGHSLAEYIHNPAGGFANLPGDFEVPSGAFARDGAIYVFYTTVASPSDVTMIGSYLARWDAPSVDAIPAYRIVSAIPDPDFINVAAAVDGDTVYLFGTGAFRASPVHLARTRDLAGVPETIERYDAATGTWGSAGAPIIDVPGHGETSVRYFANLDRWMFLAEELTPPTNRIVARFADRPEGPWSDAIVVLDMDDPGFRERHCCAVVDACTGDQFMHCERTGFYGAYLLPDAELHADGRFTVTYTLSSFDPYNAVLIRTTFAQPVPR